MAYLQAYVRKWIVSVYAKAATAVAPVAAAASSAPKPAFPVEGVPYLAVTAALVLLVTIMARVTGRQRSMA
jgi:hypothetical protein